jgi:Asp-tRNA(Asn)/Glu-tRNA(Gln) amidotransferase A subunit family amidase
VDGFPTRAGSTLPPEELAGTQGPCVQSLVDAGALVLGKTVTTEFAYFEPGPTCNPYDPGRTPGGSSSGSAAAVATGLCPLAIGTQTMGSIIRPAAYCGVVGFKPSAGRISTDGIVPFSPTADQVGIFTQDVTGMAAAAAVLIPDWQPAALSSPAVLGVPVGPYMDRCPLRTRRAFEAQMDFLADLGWPVEYVPVLDDIKAIDARHRRMVAAEFAAVHARWYEEFAARYRPKTAELIRIGQSVSPEEVQAGRESGLELRQRLAKVMAERGVDIWVSPAAMGPADEGLKSTGDPAMNLPWTHAGVPVVTVPAALTRDGLPLGMQLAAGWMADERLLAWADKLHSDIGPELY